MVSWLARGVATLGGSLAACGGGGGGTPPTIVVQSVTIDASVSNGTLRPLWRDHYDLSFEQFDYDAEPGFVDILQSLEPRSWRCSVGRWEVGFPPPPGGDSTDPVLLGQINREFYRGPNTLLGADDPANYDFGYLDAQLASLVAQGLDPFLCFDYMPLVLAAEQDPFNSNNANLNLPGSPYSTYSFSNGIRTSPPADPAVYARVVRNTMRHTRGLFAGTTDFGVTWCEVGNEPDLVDGMGTPLPFFWAGTDSDFFAMYAAIAAEVDADPLLSGQVVLGAGSFAFLPSVTGTAFLQSFLNQVGMQATRLDFLSFHTYSDIPEDHLGQFLLVQSFALTAGVSVPWVNAEWGRELGGTDPVYDQIEHGLLRAKTLTLMQLFPFVLAHQAVYRNPGTMPGELGLTRTGPPGHKPVSRVYQGLNRMNETLDALEVTSNPDSLFVLTGRNGALSKVVAQVMVDAPSPGTLTEVLVEIQNLPWGLAAFEARQFRVVEASAQTGIESLSLELGSGGAWQARFSVPEGQAGLYWVELDRQ